MNILTTIEKPPYAPRVEALAEKALSDRGHTGWTLRWLASDAFCWRNQKQIDICPMESESACVQMLLHEIAHANVVVERGNQHVPEFFSEVRVLVKKYLGEKLDGHQTLMASIYAPDWEEEPK